MEDFDFDSMIDNDIDFAREARLEATSTVAIERKATYAQALRQFDTIVTGILADRFYTDAQKAQAGEIIVGHATVGIEATIEALIEWECENAEARLFNMEVAS